MVVLSAFWARKRPMANTTGLLGFLIVQYVDVYLS